MADITFGKNGRKRTWTLGTWHITWEARGWDCLLSLTATLPHATYLSIYSLLCVRLEDGTGCLLLSAPPLYLYISHATSLYLSHHNILVLWGSKRRFEDQTQSLFEDQNLQFLCVFDLSIKYEFLCLCFLCPEFFFPVFMLLIIFFLLFLSISKWFCFSDSISYKD